NRETVRALARQMNDAIAGFVRGQTAVCLILGSFYAVGLSLTGLSFGLLIGLVSGLLTFIPYVGSMTGLVLSVGIAIAQFWPAWTPIVTVAAIFFAGQILEGYVLAPKLVGESVGLHPVWLMFALFAFAYLFGFVGMLVAVPLAAAFGVLTRFALAQYRASPLYTGRPAPGRRPPPRRRLVPRYRLAPRHRPRAFRRRPAWPPAPRCRPVADWMQTRSAPRQLALALSHAESFAREDFLPGPGNAGALALVERWPDWPARVVALVG